MKILLEGFDGTLANFDNIFDIHSTQINETFHVRARSVEMSEGCYEVVTLFKGTEEEADEWMKKFKDAIVNARESVCIISIKGPKSDKDG